MPVTHFEITLQHKGKPVVYLVKKFAWDNKPVYYAIAGKTGTRHFARKGAKWILDFGLPLDEQLISAIGAAIDKVEAPVKPPEEYFD
jgi:hypothetical protein